MRPGQQNKRGRGRGNNNNNNNGGGNNFNRKGSNPLTRTYDSSGPDIKIRGTAQHIAEKYATLARDAQSAGDRVMAENYLQHAEHYNRIIAAAQAQMQERFQRDDRNDYADRDGDEIDNEGDDAIAAEAPAQPAQPQPQQPRPQQERRQHQNRQQNAPRQQAQQPQPEVAVAAETAPGPEAAPAPVAPAPVAVDGTGPQPVIEGTPAEVAMEAEEAAEAAGTAAKTPRRRSGAATRPRRQPRRAAGEEGAEAAPAPALETAGSE